MLDLDASYQREQLLLEVLLDIRDALAAPAQQSGTGTDALAALESIRRVTRLR